MQLRKVELVGFKSFVERTELSFDGGITAIVGPNGCGKSNIVDAVRWVLGEQSAKSLRAEGMGDCIFAGTSTRKPLGFAEVTLLFDNSERLVDLEYDEVALTRRVYGSGEGQYFINGRPSRLRDIRELMMGSGVGTTAYSIIEQGEIGRIISSDPRELRAVFDEAAGISLYKARLKTASGKLERVNQNLLRVGDILAEVEKRLRSVKYQAAKARRFREMTERLRQLRLVRSRHDFQELSSRRDLVEGRLRDARAEVAGLDSRLGAMESDSDRANERLMTVEEEIERVAADHKRLEKEIDDLGFTMELARERIAHHRSNRARLESVLAAGTAELEEAEKRVAGLEKRKHSIERRTERLSLAAERLEEEEKELSRREGELSRRIGALEAEAVESLRAAAGLNNRLWEITAEERAAHRRAERAGSRREELDRLVLEMEKKAAALQASRGDHEKAIQRRRLELEGVESLRAASITTREDIDRSISQAAGRLRAVESRRELLEDLHKRREGVSEAAQSLLDRGMTGTLGLVADLIEVPRHLAVPVEKLLGENAAGVVVESTADALDAAEHLSTMGSARVRIISLERARAVDRRRRCESLTAVADHVGCRQDCHGIVEALLGDCFLADDLQHALSVNGHASDLRVATPRGDILERDACISTGGCEAAGGLIWRRTEIERLAAEENELRSQLELLQRRRDELAGQIAQLDERRAVTGKALSEDTAAMAGIEAAVSNLESRISDARREMDVLESESREVTQELSELASERQDVADKITCVQSRGAEVESQAADSKRERLEVTGRLEKIRARHTRLKVVLASAMEKQSHLSRRFSQAASQLCVKVDSLKAARAEIAEAQDLASREAERIEDARRRLDAAGCEVNAARVVLAARANESTGLRAEISRLSPSQKALRARLEEARTALSELSVEEREVSVRLSDVISRARDELGVTPEELAEDVGEVEDADAIAEEVTLLAGKLSSMGAVNMEALDELDELETRHAFLSGQRDDLHEASESLQKVIARTRAKSRKMFMESFEAVREHFSRIFRRIFAGGKADCVLLDPEDVLESRIQVMAKPPGKELSQLSLLSGGEKAMTAVSLLFAMFSTRRSPFLILDEVDAPMDESNIGRFIDLMRDFLPASQFIVITHSRRTMAAADTLYGITMEEQGVSRKVSISFRDEAAALEGVPA